MEITDANVILRYLLNDHEVLSLKAGQILEKNSIHVPFEVCAEVVYVLEKVYNITRKDIRNALTLFVDYTNITTNDALVLKEALKIYETQNIDFVDSVLIAFHHIRGVVVHSFDKKVNQLCGKK
jgi:predicted nucleic-acid-binding protein